ncbi:hypothetical protein MNBD_GAMMA24-543 [hydrothermal vent metagenome]|uniref:CzcB-like C-terminal circularly permuted SH3-like domain-containing protein n=1 Tax=hydrothermal vent metagenome TaxID=652676 RepID=A0A3B1BE82_9ZZZZ
MRDAGPTFLNRNNRLTGDWAKVRPVEGSIRVSLMWCSCYWFLLLMMLGVMPVLADSPPTETAIAGTWQPQASAFARVSAHQQTVLSLPFFARIVALNVEPGTKVAAGDELLRFDAPRLRQRLAVWKQALLELRLAKKRLQVLRESERQHVITRQERVLGEQAVAQAQGQSGLAWQILAADLDLLHIQIDKKTLENRISKSGLQAIARNLGRLRAPFAGVISMRRAALGEQLSAGSPLLELEVLDPVYVDVGVPVQELPLWRGGETYWLRDKQQISLQRLDGVPLYDAGSGLWLRRYESKNPGELLRDGAWIEVQHQGAPQAVVWVPAAAVVARNGKSWCVIQKQHQFKAVEVRVGAASAGRIPVLSGLEAGTNVVTLGAYELLYRDLKELIKFVD